MNEDYWCEECGQVLAEEEIVVCSDGQYCQDCSEDTDEIPDN